MSDKRPLEIGCKASSCGQGLPAERERHAFRSPAGTLPGLGGDCLSCNAAGLVDWELCHAMGPTEFPLVTTELRKELLRDNYWGLALPEHVLRKARKRTPAQLETSIALVLAGALRPDNPRAGFQTPWAYSDGATIVHCAQHATGTCCRACVEKWFGLPARGQLTTDQLALLARFAMTYVDARLAEPADVVLEAA